MFCLLQVIGAAEGLKYLHSNNIVHSDLKGVRDPLLRVPMFTKCLQSQRNVLIDNRGVPKLCDFGRSKITDRRGYTTIFIGSARYIAPELIAFVNGIPAPAGNTSNHVQGPNLTKETDIYSFSMVVIEVSLDTADLRCSYFLIGACMSCPCS